MSRQALPQLHVDYEEDIFIDKRVLLVDDDDRNIYALQFTLEDEWECDVTVANNGVEAINAIQAAIQENPTQPFDIVLMDIMMPVMDGYEAMNEIRKMPGLRELPIIALTANAMAQDQQKCFDNGASNYLSKPIDLNTLQSMMAYYILNPGP